MEKERALDMLWGSAGTPVARFIHPHHRTVQPGGDSLHLEAEIGEIVPDGLPYPAYIHIGISVREHIAHVIGEVEWQLRVGIVKRRIAFPDIVSGFPDILDVPDDRILNQRVRQEIFPAHAAGIGLDPPDRFQDMPMQSGIRSALLISLRRSQARDP